MKISGHRTRAVFDRYDIVSEKDIKDASGKVEEYLNGQKEALMERRDKVVPLKKTGVSLKSAETKPTKSTKPIIEKGHN